MNKKGLYLLLTGVFCIMLCACGADTASNTTEETSEMPDSVEQPVEKTEGQNSINQKVTSLVFNQSYSVSDYADFSFVSVETTKTVGSAKGHSGVYYENTDPDQTYIDAVFEVTNTGSTAVRSASIMTATAKAKNGSEYPCTLYAVEIDGQTSLSEDEIINPLTTARFHAAISVPESENEFKLNFVLNGAQFTYHFNKLHANAIPKKPTDLKVGDVIDNPDYAALEFVSAKFTEEVLPSNTSGYYRYYQTDNPDYTYLALEFKVTNYQSTSRDIDTFLSATSIFMDKYEYTGFVVSEDTDLQGLSTYNEISPLQTARVIYLIEIPKSVINENYSVELYFDKQTFTYVS